MNNFGKSLKNSMEDAMFDTGGSGTEFMKTSNEYIDSIEEDTPIFKKKYKKSDIKNLLSKNKSKLNLPIGKITSMSKQENKEVTGTSSAGGYSQPLFTKTKKQIQEDILKGGLADMMSIEDIFKKHKKKYPNLSLDMLKQQLKKGIKVEMEHTNDKIKSEEIAKDHLYEDPNYYTKLQKMETKEATSTSSSGAYESPAFLAKSMSKKNWRGKSKTQIPGGKFVEVKSKCKKFPYCNQGDINALKFS